MCVSHVWTVQKRPNIFLKWRARKPKGKQAKQQSWFNLYFSGKQRWAHRKRCLTLTNILSFETEFQNERHYMYQCAKQDHTTYCKTLLLVSTEQKAEEILTGTKNLLPILSMISDFCWWCTMSHSVSQQSTISSWAIKDPYLFNKPTNVWKLRWKEKLWQISTLQAVT